MLSLKSTWTGNNNEKVKYFTKIIFSNAGRGWVGILAVMGAHIWVGESSLLCVNSYVEKGMNTYVFYLRPSVSLITL